MKQGCTYAININICMARGDNECPWVDIVQSSNPCVNVKVVSGCARRARSGKRGSREDPLRAFNPRTCWLVTLIPFANHLPAPLRCLCSRCLPCLSRSQLKDAFGGEKFNVEKYMYAPWLGPHTVRASAIAANVGAFSEQVVFHTSSEDITVTFTGGALTAADVARRAGSSSPVLSLQSVQTLPSSHTPLRAHACCCSIAIFCHRRRPPRRAWEEGV